MALVKGLSDDQKKRAGTIMSLLADGGTIYVLKVNKTSSWRRIFVVNDGRIVDISYSVACVCAFRFRDDINAHLVHPGNPGGGEEQHIAETLKERLGYQKIVGEKL